MVKMVSAGACGSPITSTRCAPPAQPRSEAVHGPRPSATARATWARLGTDIDGRYRGGCPDVDHGGFVAAASLARIVAGARRWQAQRDDVHPGGRDRAGGG